MKKMRIWAILLLVAAVAGAAYYLGVKSVTSPPAAGGTDAVSDTGVSGVAIPPNVPAAPVPELEADVKEAAAGGYLYAIGIGESTDEMTARSVSIDNARADIAAALLARPHGTAQPEVNVASSVRKTVTQYDKGSGRYRVYSLAVQNKEVTRADSAEIEGIMNSLGTGKK